MNVCYDEDCTFTLFSGFTDTQGSCYLGEVPRLGHDLSEQVRNIACKKEMKIKSQDEVGDIDVTEV